MALQGRQYDACVLLERTIGTDKPIWHMLQSRVPGSVRGLQPSTQSAAGLKGLHTWLKTLTDDLPARRRHGKRLVSLLFIPDLFQLAIDLLVLCRRLLGPDFLMTISRWAAHPPYLSEGFGGGVGGECSDTKYWMLRNK